MCKFFSVVSDPTQPIPERFKYFNWEQRQDFLKGKIKEESPDSHTSIAHFHGYSARNEDNLNKYEYNPLTGIFTVDKINNRIDDSSEVEEWVRKLDFSSVVAPLIIKPITHPFKVHPPEITPEILELLKQWASVRDSVGDSVGDSVWDSVGDSVGDSVWAYTGSFFDIKYKVNIKPSNDLWNKGIVPSFDGTLWRLHGKEGKVIYTISKEDLKKYKG